MERKGFIGGSDIASLYSIKPYGCRRRLFYEKIGQPEDYPDEEESFHIRRGKLFEPVAAQMFAEETGKTIEVVSERLVDKDLPYLGGLIDRRIVEDGGRGTLEIKCPSMRVYKQVKLDGISEGYLLQGQVYNRVDGSDYTEFANLSAELAELFHFRVLRDEELMKKVLEGAAAFWELLQRREIPDKLPAKDKRCKTCKFGQVCQGITQEEYEILKAGDPDLIPVVDPTLSSLIDEYWEVRTIAKEADELFEEAKDRMKEYMIGNGFQRVAAYGSKVYAAPQMSMRWDTKALEKDHPELIEKYKKPSTSLPLRVYHIKS